MCVFFCKFVVTLLEGPKPQDVVTIGQCKAVRKKSRGVHGGEGSTHGELRGRGGGGRFTEGDAVRQREVWAGKAA